MPIQNAWNSPQRRRELKVFLLIFVKEILCALCVFAVKTVLIDEHQRTHVPHHHLIA